MTKLNYEKIRRKPTEFADNKINSRLIGKNAVMIFTDGSCLKNPGGPGGWAAIISTGQKEVEIFGCEASTTNNRMEMLGAIMALEYLSSPHSVTLATDSQYLVQGATKWLAGWKRRGWRTQDGTPVKNRDLWQRIDNLCQIHVISWTWVRGHNGHAENERCDELAGRAAREQIAQ